MNSTAASDVKIVAEISSGGKAYFKCVECGFTYDEQTVAQACEDWCRKNESCNLEITQKAVILNDAKPIL